MHALQSQRSIITMHMVLHSPPRGIERGMTLDARTNEHGHDKQHMASGGRGRGWLVVAKVGRRPESSVDSSFPSFFPRGKEAAILRQRDAPRAWAEEFEGNESGSKVCVF